jgi:hypothetical protein
MKVLDDYSRENAITMPLEKGEHRSFDQTWKDWAQDQRRLGRDKVSVQELHDIMADAIERAPIGDAQKSARFTLLNEELYQKHGLSPTTKLSLPYRNMPALKPGPELTALKAKTTAEQAARTAREKTHIRNTISKYDRMVKSLERSGNKAQAQIYLLEIEKLKNRLKK